MIPQLKNSLDKPFIERFHFLHLWEEIIAACIEIETNSTETVMVLKLKNKKIGIHIAPDQLDLDFLRGMIGHEIGILRTEDCFLVLKITRNQQVSKDRYCKELGS